MFIPNPFNRSAGREGALAPLAASRALAIVSEDLALPDVTLEKFEDWRNANQRLAELQDRHRAADTRKNQAIDLMTTAGESGGKDLRRLRAEAIADGRDPDTIASGPSTLRQQAVELRAAEQECRELRDAIKIQEQRVAQIQIRRSAEACAELATPYRQIVRDLAEAVVRVAVLNQRQQLFREHYQAGGVLTSRLGAMPVISIGTLWDKESGARRFLGECLKMEFIDAREHEALMGQRP